MQNAMFEDINDYLSTAIASMVVTEAAIARWEMNVDTLQNINPNIQFLQKFTILSKFKFINIINIINEDPWVKFRTFEIENNQTGPWVIFLWIKG